MYLLKNFRNISVKLIKRSAAFFTMKKALFITIIITLACLAAYGYHLQSNISERLQETGPSPYVYFCPEDNCVGAMLNVINSANEFVHCAFYDLDLEELIRSFDSLANIDVKIIVDEDNFKGIKGKIDSSSLKEASGSGLMHNKFCIIDNRTITTGSFNPTDRGAHYNNNNLIIFHSQYLSRSFEKEFQEIYDDHENQEAKHDSILFNNQTVKHYYCPEDDCAEQIVDELRNAKKTIYFMTFSFTHMKIANILALKVGQGVEVKGVYEKTKVSKYTQYRFLQLQGAIVKPDSNKYNMHHKVFIIDNRTVITGSFNPSKNADTKNDENVLIIYDKDIAGQYVQEFNRLFYGKG